MVAGVGMTVLVRVGRVACYVDGVVNANVNADDLGLFANFVRCVLVDATFICASRPMTVNVRFRLQGSEETYEAYKALCALRALFTLDAILAVESSGFETIDGNRFVTVNGHYM